MVNATITQTICNPTQTSASFISAIETACINAGLGTLYDSYSDANAIYRIFECILDSTKTKGKVYFQIQLKTASGNINGVYSFIWDTWNAIAHTGTNSSIGYTFGGSNDVFSFGNGQTINLYSVNHPELKLIYLQQVGSASHSYGILRPASKPNWWNENTHPYAFMHSTGVALTGWNPLAAAMNPLSNNAACPLFTSSLIAAANSLDNNKRKIYGEIYLLGNNSIGDIGQTSSDLCMCAASGMNLFDIVEISPTEQYILITPGGTPGIAIRTT